MDKRKEEIIEVALRRFSHYGFGKTTMNEVADDLGITKANLYYYYPDKALLVKDVISFVWMKLLKREEEIIDSYKRGFFGTLFEVLEFRAEHMRKNYILYINENLDWIRGAQIGCFLEEMKQGDKQLFVKLFQKAVEAGDLILTDVEEAASTYIDIIKGIVISHTIQDIVTGIPDIDKVDRILESQKKAARLIFEERIVTNK